jgi:branched-chain amino acid aminotransferase
MTSLTNGTNGVHNSTPPAPSESIDWDHVGFQIHKVNGHAHATWSEGKWSDVGFRSEEKLPIHGFASCLNYGQQCFEGLKAFRSKDGQIRIFRPDENALRLAHSARMIYAPPVPDELFLEAVHLAYLMF